MNMKFSCSQHDLGAALNIAQKGVSSKTTMPILEGILFQIFEGQLILTATDTEIGVQTTIPVDAEQDGELVLKANMISDIIRKFSGDTVFFETLENQKIKIDCQMSTFTIQGLASRDFPQLPEIINEEEIQTAASDLKSLIHGTLFAVAMVENIPVLTGIKVELNEDTITMVALDGYRLAIRKAKLITPVEKPIAFIIPGKSIQELNKLLESEDEMVQIYYSKTQIFFKFKNILLTSRLLEGEFINYQHIIPQEKTTNIIVNRRDLLASCERAALMARAGKNNLLKLDFNQEQVNITSDSEVGNAFEVIPVNNSGENIKIAFNYKFLIEAIKAIEEETIRIELSTSVGPAVLLPEKLNQDTYTYLVLPVRLAED